MQAYQFLNVAHFFIHGQFQTSKYPRHHFLPDKLMLVKSPAGFWLELFGHRFGNIMKDGSPSQPQIIRLFSKIIQHFQGMVKIIFMTLITYFFDTL